MIFSDQEAIITTTIIVTVTKADAVEGTGQTDRERERGEETKYDTTIPRRRSESFQFRLCVILRMLFYANPPVCHSNLLHHLPTVDCVCSSYNPLNGHTHKHKHTETQ